MFTVGLGPIANSVFAITTMAIAVPTGVKVLNWIATLWGGSISFRTPMLFALGFIAMFTIGGISGVMHAMAPSDAQQQDTYFIVAHIHYVLFGGAIFAIMAGIYYWFPKFSGKMYNEFLGKLHFWIMTIGFNISFFPMHFAGMYGMPRRIYIYNEGMGWEIYNMLSTIGAFMMAFSFLIFIYNMVSNWRNGEDAPDDPWDARTLEWSISSPPPEYNFVNIPVVKTLDDWWNTKHGNTTNHLPMPASGGSEDDESHHDIHLPQPSYWPIILSFGLMLLGFGFIYNFFVGGLGAAIAMIAVYAWSFEPVNDPDPEQNNHH